VHLFFLFLRNVRPKENVTCPGICFGVSLVTCQWFAVDGIKRGLLLKLLQMKALSFVVSDSETFISCLELL
jgi:hypothetical protein